MDDTAIENNTIKPVRKTKSVLGNIVFSFIFGVFFALIFILWRFNGNDSVPSITVGHTYLVTMGITIVVLFLLLYFIRNFGKIFSIIIFIILGVFFIFLLMNNIKIKAECIQYGGIWEEIEDLTSGEVPSSHKCVLPAKNYENIPKNSILHSVFSTIEIRE